MINDDSNKIDEFASKLTNIKKTIEDRLDDGELFLFSDLRSLVVSEIGKNCREMLSLNVERNVQGII